jgi:hypothetical protein
MSYRSKYEKGNWKTVCDACGRLFKASQLTKRWDGVMVCQDDWEPRQTQDFVRGVADIQTPAWTRPEVADTFTTSREQQWVAGFAIAGYMVPGTTHGIGIVPPSTFTS